MITRVSLPANPAKLEFAVVASHVVASFRLLDASFTRRTKPYIFTFSPVVILLIDDAVARRKEPSVICVTTFKADFLLALANDLSSSVVFSTSVFVTARARTPLDKGVRVHHLHPFELKILNEERLSLRVSCEDTLYILVIKCPLAFWKEAFYAEDLRV